METNVATGYHAIEVPALGRDLNGTGPGAGCASGQRLRPASCSWGTRIDARTIGAVTGLLVDELRRMVDQWTDGGAARLAVTTGDLQKNLAAIFTRDGQPVVWRAGRRTHEARPDAARP